MEKLGGERALKPRVGVNDSRAPALRRVATDAHNANAAGFRGVDERRDNPRVAGHHDQAAKIFGE